jgi:hypothetical protein
MTSTAVGWRRALALAITTFAALVSAEIQEFNILLPATSKSIRYTDFYLRGPGSVDLSGLILKPVSDVHRSYYPAPKDDDDGYEEDDDGLEDDDTDDDDDAAAADDDDGMVSRTSQL